MNETRLEELDELRYHDLGAARAAVDRAIADAEPEELPYLLGIRGSCLRMAGELEAAEEAIADGLRRAADLGSLPAEAELTQRRAFVEGGWLRFRDALAWTHRATLLWVELDDRERIGQTLVDRGQWLYHLGRHRESIRSSRAALGYLEPGSWRNRYTAVTGIGYCHRALGELGPARERATEGLAIARRLGPSLHASSAQLVGEIEWELGDHRAAARSFAAAAELFRDSVIDLAWARGCCVAAQALAGGPLGGAAREAETVIFRLGRHRRLTAALWELLRTARDIECSRQTQAVIEALAKVQAEVRRRRGRRTSGAGDHPFGSG
jgi:tetratricopeptide (TPR) repeat protein